MNTPSNRSETFPGLHDVLKNHKIKLVEDEKTSRKLSETMEEIKATVEDNIKLSEHKFSSVEEEVKALKGRIDSQQKQLISAFDIMTSIANSSTQNSNSIKVLANTIVSIVGSVVYKRQ